MIYEIHTTVKATNTCEWIRICNSIGIKPLIIRLSGGLHAEQFMCSVRIPGDMILVAKYVRWLEQRLSGRGATILRSKVEIPLDQYDNWLRDEQEGGSALYMESHIRIDSAKAQATTLNACKVYGLAISHSILKGNFWATQRLTPDNAPLGYVFDKTYEALKEITVPVIDMHSEAVLMDSNPDLDKGWVNFDLQKGYVAA